MGRNKVEREFSVKLNQREIKPSENSWDRLNAMLAVAEQTKPVRKLNWLYLAASFLGIALLATFFFNRSAQPASKNDTIIVQQEKSAIQHSDPVPLQKQIQNEIAAVESNSISKDPKSIQYSSKKRNVAHNEPDIETAQRQNSIINQNSINQVSINQSNQTNQPTVDELLAMAQSNATSSDVTKSVKVNANGLLSQVDGNQNRTFRQKVLHKVGKNYQSVKVALANRNIEDENH